jgi:LPXTG-motif cell wall-anchored protein
MMRIATLLVGLAGAAGMLLSAAAPAGAVTTSDAVAALRGDNLYVGDPSAKLDQSGARSSLHGAVKVAVLPSGTGDARALAVEIGQGLGGRVTVGVFEGRSFSAASNLLCAGRAGTLAGQAVSENRSQLQSDGDLTNTIKSFASLVSSAQPCSAGSGGSTAKTNSSGTSGWAVLGVLGLLGAGGVGGLLWRRRRKDRRALADARALIQPYYDRLAADINSLQPGDNPTARQAMADASERFNSGGSQLASATSLAQLGGARRSILEGLQASRTARVALGIDPGPDLPPLADTPSPQLSQPQNLSVNGQPVQGYPSYTPGAPYYFAGGGGYAGGWYSMPFWETLLIAEALSPGWGWGFGGGYGGWGGGYEAGYDSGFDAAQDAHEGDGGGGDWGGGDFGGGGDWGGGGGGDFGGGGGGGDW